jgi:phage baseplate assembly protein W
VSAVRYRGIRFITSAGEGEGSGLRVDAKGDLETVEDDSAVRQAILLLIATRPGERVMRPAYGCDLQRLVFSPNDDTTAGLAVHYVRRALESWEPRIEIASLDAVPDGSGGALTITLDYRVRATQRRDLLVVRFSLGTAS